MRTSPTARSTALVSLACLALLIAAGCSTGARPTVAGEQGASSTGESAAATTSTTLPAVAVLGTPGDNATNVALDSPIVVKAADESSRTSR